MTVNDITIPEWVSDAVFYQIFPDRFARSGRVKGQFNLEPWTSAPTRHGFKGGDLWGVMEKLDYLQDLGIDALYLNPVFQSTANHRYHTHDYYQVDPLLGGNQALRDLLDAAHARDIRVVLDGVFNHASRGFFQFNHILENGPDSPYVDWFTVQDYPLHAYSRTRSPNYDCWWGLRALPEFNTDNPDVRAFLFDVARHWIAFGIDGWRLDVPGEIDDDSFWQEFRHVVKETNPEAYLVGEIWEEGGRWLQGDQFDAVMNYVWGRAVLGFTLERKLPKQMWPGGRKVKPLNAPQFAAEIDRILALHPREITYAQLNLLDSHDTPRFITLAGGETARFKLATLLQMTYPGAPCIYYGDEIGLQGGHDPDCRAAFPWDEGEWNHTLRAYVRQLVSLRQELAPLRRGDLVALYADKTHDTYVFARRYRGKTVAVAVNMGDQDFRRRLPARLTDWPDGTILTERLTGTRLRVREGEIRGLQLSPLSGALVTAAEDA